MIKIISPGLVLALMGVLAAATSVSAAEDRAADLLVPSGSIRIPEVQLNDPPPRTPTPSEPINNPVLQEPEVLDNYGLVKGIQHDKVSVRLLNGDTRTYLLASNTVGAKLTRGGLVGFKTNSQGEITRLSPPQVRKIYRGTLVIVDGQKIGMVTPQGDRFITTLSKDKIAQMGLAPGQFIKITQYRGTWATKICQSEALSTDDSDPTVAEQEPHSIGAPITPLGR
jgi:hypothetical protein